MPNNPVLYFRDINSKKDTMTLNQLIASKPLQVIQFESGNDKTASQIESVVFSGDENTINEPEISASASKRINKQSVGALPEGITITGNIDITQTEILSKLRLFYRMPQIEYNYHEFGKVGFYSNGVTFFDVDPTDSIGYTIKPPTITWIPPKKQVSFKIELLLGGKDL